MTSRKKTIAKPTSKDSLNEHFSAKTPNQKDYLRSIVENTVTFCTGSAGTGKSYLALGMACQKFLSGEFDKLIVVRPAIEASYGKGIGYLKGSYEDKIFPYLLPAIEHIKRFIGTERFEREYELGNISFEVLEYLRGRTFNYSIIVAEECQDCVTEQLVMLVSRLGTNSKIIINGDSNQSDLTHKSGEFKTDLDYVISKIKKANLESFNHVEMTHEDIMRNPIIGPFLKVFE